MTTIEFLKSINPFKDVFLPFAIAWLGFWLASRKFKKEKMWQEKYDVYKEIVSSAEAISYWSEQARNESVMLPTIGWFDGKKPHEFYAEAKRRLTKHAAVGNLLISKECVDLLSAFLSEIFKEEFRAEDERSHDQNDDEDFRVHVSEINKIAMQYLPKIIDKARKDLYS